MFAILKYFFSLKNTKRKKLKKIFALQHRIHTACTIS